MLRIGYACMNLTLGATTSHHLRLANLHDRDRLRRAIDANFADARRILPWNAEHGYRLFRLGQSFIPFASHPRFPYAWQTEHADELRDLGRLARQHRQRLSMHPGQYVNPGSPDPGVVERSLAELRYAAELIHLLEPEHGVVVIHLGGVFGDRAVAARRFIANLRRQRAILRHLALENDETGWSPEQVLPVARRLGVPVIVDTLHHRLNPGHLTLREAIDQALRTWIGRPKLHLSSQDPVKQSGAHAARIAPADWHELMRALAGRDADVMIEAKLKEQALPPSLRPAP